MKILINKNSMIPIYEQIAESVKALIRDGQLKENDHLPSIREEARILKVSALTVKKAYDSLEQEGIITTIAGKGSFISKLSPDYLLDEKIKVIEKDLETIINRAQLYGLSRDDLEIIFRGLMEEYNA